MYLMTQTSQNDNLIQINQSINIFNIMETNYNKIDEGKENPVITLSLSLLVCSGKMANS